MKNNIINTLNEAINLRKIVECIPIIFRNITLHQLFIDIYFFYTTLRHFLRQSLSERDCFRVKIFTLITDYVFLLFQYSKNKSG